MRKRFGTGIAVAVGVCVLGAWGFAGSAAGYHGTAPAKGGGKVLKVKKTGQGKKHGTVTSDPAGIDCGTTCSFSFDPGTTVSLKATAEDGAVFKSWKGACHGTDPNSCQVTMSKSQHVDAAFGVGCVVPDVVGLKFGKARRTLSHAHCKAKKTRVFSDSVKKGHVISQDPGPGTVLPKGGKVTLVVSKGKQH